MSYHPDLERGRLIASAYRVRRSERGWHVWRFIDWSRPTGGWRIVVPDCKTREDGGLHVLSRLGLMKDDPPEQLPPAPTRVSWTDTEWL